jgi:hypothetical protein
MKPSYNFKWIGGGLGDDFSEFFDGRLMLKFLDEIFGRNSRIELVFNMEVLLIDRRENVAE